LTLCLSRGYTSRSMDESVPNTEQPTSTVVPEIGFPAGSQKPKSKAGVLVFVALGILVLGGAIAFFLHKRASSSEISTPTPMVESDLQVEPTDTPAATSTPTPTSKPQDRSKIAIEIQNGSGIVGDASSLKKQLVTLGYSDIKTGNAPNQNYTSTVVTFAKTLDASVVAEITKKLQAIYDDVQTKTSSTQDVDVLIISGQKSQGSATITTSPTPTTAAE
jgi:hypothetical protein